MPCTNKQMHFGSMKRKGYAFRRADQYSSAAIALHWLAITRDCGYTRFFTLRCGAACPLCHLATAGVFPALQGRASPGCMNVSVEQYDEYQVASHRG